MDEAVECNKRSAETNLAAGTHHSNKDWQTTAEYVRKFSQEAERSGCALQSDHSSASVARVRACAVGMRFQFMRYSITRDISVNEEQTVNGNS